MSAEETRNPSAHERLAQLAEQLQAPAPAPAVSTTAASTSAAPSPQPAPPQRPPLPPLQIPPAPAAASAAPPSLDPIAASKPQAAPPSDPERKSAPSPAAASIAPPTPVAAKPESNLRAALVTYFPMAIAVLSLCLSIYQGYLFHRSIDLMERNVARGEYIRTCRDIIETYFVVKQKVGALMPAADRSNIAGASRVTENNRLEAQAAIAKFGGLGTYLANFQDPGTRARYTELTRALGGIMDTARNTQLTDIDKLFEPADKIFTSMNDDCVRIAREMRM